MKLSIFILASLSFLGHALAATPPIDQIGQRTVGEKCTFLKAVQDSGNNYDALMNVKTINIYGEWSIMQGFDTSRPIPNFPKANTMLSFAFDDIPEVGPKGDEIYKTLQTSELRSLDDKPVTLDKLPKVFKNVYTHSFELNTPSRKLKVTAVHSVVQYADHWYSKDVIVTYKLVEPSPFQTVTRGGEITFACKDYEEVKDWEL